MKFLKPGMIEYLMKETVNTPKIETHRQFLKQVEEVLDFHNHFVTTKISQESLKNLQLSESTNRIAHLLNKGWLAQDNQVFTVEYDSFEEALELKNEFSKKEVQTAVVNLASLKSISNRYALQFTKEDWRAVLSQEIQPTKLTM